MVTDYSSHQIKRTMVGKQGLGHPCPPSLGLEHRANGWALDPRALPRPHGQIPGNPNGCYRLETGAPQSPRQLQ